MVKEENEPGGAPAFCTAVNCMDGRVQTPVTDYMKARTGARYVDMITEPGPVRILAERTDAARVQSLLTRIEVSVQRHGSRTVAVVAHYDCAGNPEPETVQRRQLAAAVAFLKQKYPAVEVAGLWVGPDWRATEPDPHRNPGAAAES